jgi:4-hydroxy-4-methyl-2-oxoglutarate aldolase
MTTGKRKMTKYKTVTDGTIKRLHKLDTCLVSNTIEQFNVRLRSEGFMNSSVHCQYPSLPPRAGYAVTGRIRTSSTPFEGRCYYENMDWWSYLVTIPSPRFVVLQDSDHSPGAGAFIGETHANIAVALDCAACVTNGAMRDVAGVRGTGLQVFAGNVAVSHAYAHVTEFGSQVEVGGLLVKPGDLVHGDQHGVHVIPISIADQLPAAADKVLAFEQEMIALCRSPGFSLERLAEKLAQGRRR